MKHRINICKLNMKSKHRCLMFRNMINSLINYEIIKTTLPKSKRLKKIIDPIINLSKNNSHSNRKLVYSKIRNKKNLFKLFNVIAPRYINRNGGYVQIINCGYRTGDNAKMSIIKFIV